MNEPDLLQIKAPHFCAGVIIHCKVVTQCAPILNYMKGWTISRVHKYCQNKNWTVTEVDSDNDRSQDKA